MYGSFLGRVYGPPHDGFRVFLRRAWGIWGIAFLSIFAVILIGASRFLSELFDDRFVEVWWKTLSGMAANPLAVFVATTRWVFGLLYSTPLALPVAIWLGLWLALRSRWMSTRVAGVVITAGAGFGSGWVILSLAGVDAGRLPLFVEPVVGLSGLTVALVLLFRSGENRRLSAFLLPVAAMGALALHGELLSGPILFFAYLVGGLELVVVYGDRGRSIGTMWPGLQWTVAATSHLFLWILPLVLVRGADPLGACRSFLAGVARRPVAALVAVVATALQGALVYPVVAAAVYAGFYSDEPVYIRILLGILNSAISALLISLHVYFLARMGFAIVDAPPPEWQSGHSG
jgi:hypothetical protein